MYGRFFAADDWPTLAAATRLDLAPGADLAALGRELDEAAMALAIGTITRGQPTWGELAEFPERWDVAAHALLHLLAPPADPGADHAYDVSRLLAFRAHPADLRLSEARVQCLLDLLYELVIASKVAAFRFRRRQGKRVTSPDAEVWFYRQIGRVYLRAFGRPWSFSTSRDGARTGPALRFCRAIGDRIAERAPGAPGPGATRLQDALDRLRDPSKASDRIRASRTLEKRP